VPSFSYDEQEEEQIEDLTENQQLVDIGDCLSNRGDVKNGIPLSVPCDLHRRLSCWCLMPFYPTFMGNRFENCVRHQTSGCSCTIRTARDMHFDKLFRARAKKAKI